jgi:hypothetical protein
LDHCSTKSCWSENASTQGFAPEQAEKDRVQLTDEPLEKEAEILYARNQAENLQDEVARLKEWKNQNCKLILQHK